MPCARLPNSLAYVESVSRQGGLVLGDERWRLVPTGGSGEATTCNTSIGPVLRGSSCAVIPLIKKTTRESCARMPPTPGSRAAPGMPSSGVGGSPFAVDPKLSADQATVFWRASALPTVVPLAPSPTSFTGARAIDFAELGEVKERAGPDGRHVIIRTDSVELRVWLLDYPVEQPLALALPLDDDLPIRVPAALRLWARIVRCAPARGRAVEDIFVARYDDQIGQRWACADASGLPQAASRPLIPSPFSARFGSSRFDTQWTQDPAAIADLVHNGVAISSRRYSPSLFAHALRHCGLRLAGDLRRPPQHHGASTMPDPLAGLPPRFLRTPEAARYLGLSGRTLEKHRTYGTGPKYRKIGGRVVYALDDLKVWADLGAKTSTSDPGVAMVYPAKRSVAPGRPVAQSHRR